MKTRARAWRLETILQAQLTMNSRHKRTKSKFRQCCIANAKWMAFANWKVAIFYVLNGAALELQFVRKSYVSIIRLRFWAPENIESWRGVIFTHQYCRFAFVFRIVALEYWFLRVSLSNGSIWQVYPGSQCLKRACPKEASGNTFIHHHNSIGIIIPLWRGYPMLTG